MLLQHRPNKFQGLKWASKLVLMCGAVLRYRVAGSGGRCKFLSEDRKLGRFMIVSGAQFSLDFLLEKRRNFTRIETSTNLLKILSYFH